MVLKFPSAWRFNPPQNGTLLTDHISEDAIHKFFGLIRKTTTQGDTQDFLEHFKRHFCAANGNPHYRSSSTGWAETDLLSEMSEAGKSPPLFLEAFYDACVDIRKRPGDLFAPDADLINEICRRHEIGYRIDPPELKLIDKSAAVIPPPKTPPTLAEQAREILHESIQRADRLLMDGRGREAVQENLWLLETVTTAFRGINTGTGTIEGKYFNQIVKELRKSHRGKTLDPILDWMTSLHGYLSSPTGGGVRHGLDLSEGLELTAIEARLFCNLIRSYLSYLLSEHQRFISKALNNGVE